MTVCKRYPRLDPRCGGGADAQALYWSIYAEETPVGLVMIADEVGTPDCIAAPHLWKAAHRRALPATRLRYSNARPDRRVLPVSGRRLDVDERRARLAGSPVTFHDRSGFKPTGDLHGNEILLRLGIS
jgi:hypothetical protein